MSGEIVNLFLKPLVDIWDRFTCFIPNILAALLFILVGLFLARAVRTLFERLLKNIKLDEYTSKVGINEIFARFGFGKSPSYVIVFVLFWSILFVFLAAAANALNLTAISALLEWFLLFVPKLVVAVIIVFSGLLFARFVSEIVSNSATANNLRGGAVFAKVVYAIIIIFAAVMALEQIGIEMSLVRSSVNIMLGSIGLAFAIAVGLGAKDFAANSLRELFGNGKQK